MIANGTGLKVTMNSAIVAHAAKRRIGSSGVSMSAVTGWPRPNANSITAQNSHPYQNAIPEDVRDHDHQDASEHDQSRNHPMAASEQRVDYVAAVKLARGQTG